jgi:hypothetical protein
MSLFTDWPWHFRCDHNWTDSINKTTNQFFYYCFNFILHMNSFTAFPWRLRCSTFIWLKISTKYANLVNTFEFQPFSVWLGPETQAFLTHFCTWPKPEFKACIIRHTQIYKSELQSGVGCAEVGRAQASLGLRLQSVNHGKLAKQCEF